MRQLQLEADRDASARLVTKKYMEQGYVKEGEISPIQHFLRTDSSAVFGAFVNDELYGTIAIVSDNEQGLPMEAMYQEELRALRGAHGILGEVVQFAIDQDICKNYLSQGEVNIASVPLFASVLKYAVTHKISVLVISVNPKHVALYHHIGFTIFGEEKHYEAVSAPAVPMMLETSYLESDEFSKNMLGKAIRVFLSSGAL